MSEELKAIYHRLNEEAWNERNFELIDEIMSPDLVVHWADGTTGDFTEYRAGANQQLAQFPDFHFKTEQIIAEGDIVAVHWTFEGTNDGPIPDLNLEATGKAVTLPGMGFYRFESGKIVEMWTLVNALAWAQQLGVIPPLAEGEG
jgi:predicted ester cyclase